MLLNNLYGRAAAPAAYVINTYNPRPYEITEEIPTRLIVNFLIPFTVFTMKFG